MKIGSVLATEKGIMIFYGCNNLQPPFPQFLIFKIVDIKQQP